VDERLTERLAAFVGGTAVYVDPLASEPYHLHFFEITIRGKDTRGTDVTLYGELVAVHEESGECEIVPADVLLNLAAHAASSETLPVALPKAAEDFLKSTYQLHCRDRSRQEREHFASVCRDYLIRSFEARKRKAQERVMGLMARERTSPEVALARQQAEKYLADLERTQVDRLAGLDRLATARTGPVRHLASALVLTPHEAPEAQLADLVDEADQQVRIRSELAAEEVAIAALVAAGFPRENVERVGAQKIGFDLRAHKVRDRTTGEIEVKRVEVKGRVRGQPVRLTVNEWYKAQQLAESYWLYVVWDPLSESPELTTVHNPAARLDHAKREIVAARFFEISAEAIISSSADTV
jgi:hypothetical protein